MNNTDISNRLPSSTTWHRIALTSDDDGPASLTVGDQAILVTRSSDEWLAIEDRCSHAGCSFTDDGEITGGVAICNCHGSEFDLRTGAALSIPAKDPIRTYPVRVVDGWLEVGVLQ